MNGVATSTGTLTNILVKHASLPEDLQHLIRTYNPRTDIGRLAKRIAPLLPIDDAKELFYSLQRIVVVESELALVVIRGLTGYREDYGVVGRKVVTDAGVGFIVDAFQNSVELENMKYHGIGTGTNAEAAGDTALQTELTTEYNPDSTRATGTTAEGATANIYKTVGTNTIDSGTPAVTEHGVFSASSAGVLLDRTKFAAINLVGANGDGIQSTYQLTLTSGS